MLAQETYPSGRVVSNQYETDGDLAQVNGSFGGMNKTYAANFSYTAAGAIQSMQLGNGRWENAQFNARLQPVQIGLGTSANAQELWRVNYDYGTTANNGNVLSQQITIQGQFQATQTYTYDSLNRLKSANETVNSQMSWQQVYNYDRYGNRTFDVPNTTTLGSCPQNQCNPTVDVSNNRFTTNQGYTYDLSGNLITDAQNRTFFYDGENKQKEVRDSQNNIVGQYLYDGDGKRVKKISNTESTIFVYDGAGNLAAEYTVTTATPQNPTTSYLTTDTLGSPRVITDQAGNVQSRRDFMPFGEEISGLGGRSQTIGYQTDAVRQKFTSYERDIESSLDYAQARMFNFSHGRFASPDDFFNDTYASNPQSWNLYAYVRNNVLNLVDPTGRMTDFIDQNGNRTRIKDGKDQVLLTPANKVEQLQNQFDKDKLGYYQNLQSIEESKYNLHMTTSEFDNLAGVIYAEASNNATVGEAGAIFGVLRNRANGDGNSVLDQANDTSQVFGAKEKDKIFDKNASESKRKAVYLGIAISVVTGADLSGGAYYWHGTDFRRPTPGSKAHERFYLSGFRFTSSFHDMWKLGDRKSESRKYDYKYESTAAHGQTTFMRLTEAWMKANGANTWRGTRR